MSALTKPRISRDLDHKMRVTARSIARASDTATILALIRDLSIAARMEDRRMGNQQAEAYRYARRAVIDHVRAERHKN